MAAGDRIFVGIQPGVFYLQEGSAFTENQWGFDSGERKWLTHPNTPKSQWPQRNQPDTQWPQMYIQEVIPRDDASGLIEITAVFRGVMRFTPGRMKERILPGADTSMFTLPAKNGENKVRVVAPVPKPKVTSEYLSLTAPNLVGVGAPFSAHYLPGLPNFVISFVPDPEEPATVNLSQGWILDDRTWEDIATKVYLVREYASFYYPIAV